MSDQIGLFVPSTGYKPHRYPWAFDYWKKQQQVHWLPEEVPLGEDCKDWELLEEHERNLLTHVFRFFTQADVDVLDNYMDRYSAIFKPVEIKMMLGAFSNMETVHVAAYSHLLDTVGMPETEYSAFMQYEAMRDKHEFNGTFSTENIEDTLLTLGMFGGFAEGLQLFASFAMLMNFPRFNKMKGMGQIVSWSVRDESLHCEGIIKLFHTLAHEAKDPVMVARVREGLRDICSHVVRMEDAFIDQAFELGPIQGATAEDFKRYTRFIADWRLRQLGCQSLYGTDPHANPLPWLQPLLSGLEHANFFEQRATEYSKASSGGNWRETWKLFDTLETN